MKCDELKVYHCNEWHNEYTEFYIKYEVDKVIAELKEKLQAADKQIENLINSASSIMLFQDRVNDNKCAELRHQKYKRCLAMARWCESEAYIHEYGSEYDEDLVAWFGKWHNKWLEFAEKFKPNKEE